MAIINNTKSNTLISGTSGKDSIYNYDGSNVTIDSGAGNDTVKNKEGDSVTINSGSGNDSIENYGSRVTISAGKGNDTIQNEMGGQRYNSETKEWEIVSTPDKVSIDAGMGNDYIENVLGYKVTIDAGGGNDTIYNSGWLDIHFEWHDGGNNAIINAGDGKDYIRNNGKKVTINSGAGNDFIENYGSKVTISGSTGNDTICNSCELQDDGSIYYYDDPWLFGSYEYHFGLNVVFNYSSGDGNDIIYGFKDHSTLSISGVSYSTKKSGDDIIVTVGEGKISLVGAASLSKINIKGKKATSTTLTVTNSTKSPVTVGSAIKTINASSRTKAVKITGNSNANTITGGSGKDTIYGGNGNDSILGGAGNDRLYGQKGNDTLWGGAGNDSLYGGAGNDVFIYKAGEGTDKIFDYTSGDMLKILNGKFSKSKYSNGTLSLTIAGGGQVLFDNVTTSTNFNINGTSYKISGSKLAKK